MGQQSDRLIGVLDELIALLRSDDETHWSAWMGKAKTRLEKSDYSGIEYLLGAYGGMGSFNDLIICQKIENGAFVSTDESMEKNERLSDLRSKAWELADAIKRSHKKNIPESGPRD
jgi:hypothetical protein